MAMIFPGMDPYLEDPQLWPGVHNRFAIYLADELQPALGSRYLAAVEERVYVEGPERERAIRPDAWVRRARPEAGGGGVAVLEADEPVLVRDLWTEVHESYLTILDRQSGQEVVAVIEIVSPSNKYAGPGRVSYLAKQAEALESRAHLVEIDLLHAGPHVLAVASQTARDVGPYHTLTCVSRAGGPRLDFELYPRRLRDRLPRIRIPLAADDPDVALDLQAVLARTYDVGRYRERLDYSKPCVPPLASDDQTWADGVIRAAAGPAA